MAVSITKHQWLFDSSLRKTLYKNCTEKCCLFNTKDDSKKNLALLFTKVVFSFVTGALISQYFQKMLSRHALLIVSLPILFLIIYYGFCILKITNSNLD